MVRSDRAWPDVYFGRPGALFKMPYPRGDMDRTFDKPVYDFATATGQHIVSSMVGGSRAFSVTWNVLHVDTYAMMGQFWTGQMGQGPWAFIDPASPNMLLPNQASATNLYADTRHFITTSGVGVALQSNATAAQIHRVGATRSLRMLWASAPGATTPIVSLTPPYRSWYGFPVVPGLPYQFSAWIKPDGVVDTSITTSVRIRWFNAAGGTISDSASADTPVTAWQRLSIGANAPALAAYGQPFLQFTGSTILAGGSAYVDELLFEQDTVVNTWAPGTGTRPVEVLSLNDPVPFDARYRRGVSMTMRELVP